MTSLQLARNAREMFIANRPATLYRAIVKEIPRVLAIYDIDMPVPEVRKAVRGMFAENETVRDGRVLEMLVEKGYMELEETLLQYKQRPHLLGMLKETVVLEGAKRKRLTPNATIDEQFDRA